MAHGPKRFVALLACAAAMAMAAPAAPLGASRLASPGTIVVRAQIYKRGRPPIYPYYYAPSRGPGGWSFYFGPVPYAKGDYETLSSAAGLSAAQLPAQHALLDPAIQFWSVKRR